MLPHLQSPIALLLLLPAALLAWWIGWRSPSSAIAASARILHLALRCAAMLLLIVALAQPVSDDPHRGASLIFVADTRAATPAIALRSEVHWIQATPAGTARTVVGFAEHPSVLALDNANDDAALHSFITQHGGSGTTDPASALKLAVGLAPAGSRLLLMSEPLYPSGDLAAVLAAATARHLIIDTVSLPTGTIVDAAVTRLDAPSPVRLGDSVPLQITVWSSKATNGSLAVSSDGQLIGKQSISLQPGDNPLLVNLQAVSEGWHIFQAAISVAGDSISQNNAMEGAVLVQKPPQVLFVSQSAAASPLVPLLSESGIQLRLAGPGQIPSSTKTLAGYDAVVLDDLPATDLSTRQVAALDGAVRTLGLGLLVLGGPDSLTLGRYTQTPLEKILPVWSETPSSLEQGNVAMQLVLDRSGSMNDLAGDAPKIVMSRSAAAIALDFVVQHKDQMGIVAFDYYTHILSPMQHVTVADAGRIRAAIGGMTADGGTNIYDGLKLGISQVAPTTAPYKHIILMTDGRSDPANYEPLLKLLGQDQITLSTVALGPDADVPLLQSLATGGKGRFYYTTNASDLPHIFAEESRLSAGNARIVGTIPVALGFGSPVTRSLAGATLPPVQGYAATVLKNDAVAPIVTQVPDRTADPILAQWQYGLGRVLVWTPGASENWAAKWLAGQLSLWIDAAHWVLRPVAEPLLTSQLDVDGSTQRVVIDTERTGGSARDLMQLEGQVQTPTGVHVKLQLEQTGPGRYEASLPPSGPGVYKIAIIDTADGAVTSTLQAVSYAADYAPPSASATMLQTIAARTGGRMLSSSSQLQVNRFTLTGTRDLWGPFVALGLLLFFVDASLRLVGWGEKREEGGFA